MRYRLPKTRIFIEVTKQGYEVYDYLGKDNKGNNKFKFLGHFGTVDGMFNWMVQLLVSRGEGTKSIKDLPEDYLRAAQYITSLRLKYSKLLAKARKDLTGK